MSAVFLNIQVEIICIDFFGFPVAIQKEWWDDNLYLAIDHDGDINVFNYRPKVLNSSVWAASFEWDSFSSTLLKLTSYEIDGLEEWYGEIWNKQHWRVQEFPIWSRP